MNRRELLSTLIVTSAAGAHLTSRLKLRRPHAGTRQPKPLTFDPAKLNGLSEKLMRSHYDNNYTGAVKRLRPDRSATGLIAEGRPGISVEGS